MAIRRKEAGRYRRFEATTGDEIISFNNGRQYRIVRGPKDQMIILDDVERTPRRLLASGAYLVLESEGHRELGDGQRLLMDVYGSYEEAVLPQGLPSEEEPETLFVRLGVTRPRADLNRIMKEEAQARRRKGAVGNMPSATGAQSRGLSRAFARFHKLVTQRRKFRSRDGAAFSNGHDRPIPSPGSEDVSATEVMKYLKGIKLPATRKEIIDHARGREAPPAVINRLEDLPPEYHSVAEIASGLGKAALPIANYGELTAVEIVGRLSDLTDEERRRVREYEQKHGARKTILRRLGDGKKRGSNTFPIANYDQLTAAEISDRVSNLSVAELEQVKRYERRRDNRKTVIRAIDRKMSA
jgi:hypothetical protein